MNAGGVDKACKSYGCISLSLNAVNELRSYRLMGIIIKSHKLIYSKLALK